eukprot:2042381-Prymnesium_polylepis.1
MALTVGGAVGIHHHLVGRRCSGVRRRRRQRGGWRGCSDRASIFRARKHSRRARGSTERHGYG